MNFKSTFFFMAVILAASALTGCNPGAQRHTESADGSPLISWQFAKMRGGAQWSDEAQAAFFNDPDNQWPLSSSELEARASRGPANWLPTLAQCGYIARFVTVMERHGLDQNPTEMAELRVQRQRCYTQFQ